MVALLSEGDARKLIGLIEQLHEETSATERTNQLTLEETLSLLGKVQSGYSKSGDSHYDLLSAMIKSIRGSDPNAGLYYLARLIEVGEPETVIMRRLLILAAEDIGNADPRALMLTASAASAVEKVGYPEARIILAQAVTYLASAPKSNASYLGINSAQESVKKTGALNIPNQIRNAPTRLMKEMGIGKDYQYAHDFDKGWVSMQFLPDEIVNQEFYKPTDHGFEKNIKAYLLWLKSGR